MAKETGSNVRVNLQRLELKEKVFPVAKLSDHLGRMVFLKAEKMRENKDTGEITYPILVSLENYDDGQLHVICHEPVNANQKKYTAIDFEKAEVIYKGAGKGQLSNGTVWGTLTINARAERPIMLNNPTAK